jgi:hypothetical protein
MKNPGRAPGLPLGPNLEFLVPNCWRFAETVLVITGLE